MKLARRLVIEWPYQWRAPQVPRSRLENAIDDGLDDGFRGTRYHRYSRRVGQVKDPPCAPLLRHLFVEEPTVVGGLGVEVEVISENLHHEQIGNLLGRVQHGSLGGIQAHDAMMAALCGRSPAKGWRADNRYVNLGREVLGDEGELGPEST